MRKLADSGNPTLRDLEVDREKPTVPEGQMQLVVQQIVECLKQPVMFISSRHARRDKDHVESLPRLEVSGENEPCQSSCRLWGLPPFKQAHKDFRKAGRASRKCWFLGRLQDLQTAAASGNARALFQQIRTLAPKQLGQDQSATSGLSRTTTGRGYADTAT